MKKRLLQLFAAGLLCLPLPSIAADPLPELEYPRRVSQGGYELRIHHPSIDRWDGWQVVEGWIPVEVRQADQEWVGALRARAATEVDLERRLVTLSRQQVVEVRFSDPDTPRAVRDAARGVLRTRTHTVLLDEVLSMLADDFEAPGQNRQGFEFNRRPPRIVVSETPLRLMLIDQQPVRAPIEGTQLEFVVNTDWQVFYDQPSRSWYVLNDGAWQNHSMLATGGWNTTDRIPDDFQNLAMGDRWKAVREALPPRLPAIEPTPFLVSLEPTELIELDGPPRLGGIPGAGELKEVLNTERDLFELEGRWYFLAAGRWFTARDLAGDWEAVEELPPEFANIPPDHRRAQVLASVPGTPEAAVALMEATLPRRTVLEPGATPGDVLYVGEPRFEPITGTRVERAVNSPYAVIRHNNFHYACHEAAWYQSPSPTGPWQPALAVPEEIYAIPPTDPLHYVTYVRPVSRAEQQSGRPEYTWNAGYTGRYSTGVTVVQGTGWHYNPWVGYPGGYPVYWGHPWTYGWRHPYGRYHHPFFYGGGYFPSYTRVEIDSPPRGVSGEVDPAFQDPNLARRGYDYSTLKEQRQAAYQAQQQASSGASLNAADDLYTDASGRVYRRDADGWSQHSDGEWNTMAELERQYGVSSPQPQVEDPRRRQAYQQNEADRERMERYYQRRSKNYHMYSNIYVGR
jgi:hypothetical protein